MGAVSPPPIQLNDKSTIHSTPSDRWRHLAANPRFIERIQAGIIDILFYLSSFFAKDTLPDLLHNPGCMPPWRPAFFSDLPLLSGSSGKQQSDLMAIAIKLIYQLDGTRGPLDHLFKELLQWNAKSS